VGHFESKFQTDGDVAHQSLLVSENYRTAVDILPNTIHFPKQTYCSQQAPDPSLLAADASKEQIQN